MDKKVKVMLDSMVSTWNMYNSYKRIEFEVETDEFKSGHWSMELKIKGVLCPEFLAFLIPALSANNCVWFMSAYGHTIIFHIQ